MINWTIDCYFFEKVFMLLGSTISIIVNLRSNLWDILDTVRIF